MKEEIIEKLMKECKFNCLERIIIKLFKRLFTKVYNETRVRTINLMLKD